VPLHRVLKKDKAAGRRLGHIVRDAGQIGLLQTEGVGLDFHGRLLDHAVFWDYTLECEARYKEKVDAAAGTSASTTDEDTDMETEGQTDKAAKDADKVYSEHEIVSNESAHTVSETERESHKSACAETESESEHYDYTDSDSHYTDDGEEDEDSD
jgi:hypothetical protein